MFFVSRVFKALSMESFRAEASESSLVVMVPFDSDLGTVLSLNLLNISWERCKG